MRQLHQRSAREAQIRAAGRRRRRALCVDVLGGAPSTTTSLPRTPTTVVPLRTASSAYSTCAQAAGARRQRTARGAEA